MIAIIITVMVLELKVPHATPGWTRCGRWRRCEDLPARDCLLSTSGAPVFDDWTFQQGAASTTVRVAGRMQINDGMALVAGAVAGGGVMVIDRLLVAHGLADGSLVQLLPNYQLRPGQPVYAVYPARPWLALTTSTFLTFLQERLFP